MDELLKKFPTLSDDVKNVAKDVASGTKSMKDFNTCLQSASTATSKFGATLKSVAANFGIMLAVSLVIKGITEVWDYFNETVEESQEEIDAINKKLETLNAERGELASRDYEVLSESEKDKLDYLNERIALEKELNKIKSMKNQKDQVGGGFTDLFDTDSYTHKIFFEKFIGNAGLDLLTGGASEHSGVLFKNTMDDINEYEFKLEEIENLKKKLLSLDKDSEGYTVTEGELLWKQTELQDYILENLQEKLLAFKENKLKYASEIDSINEILNNPYITGSTRKQAEEDLGFYQKKLENAEKFIHALEKILHAPQNEAASVTERLGGRFTKEELIKEFGEDGVSILANVVFDKNASIEDLHNLIEKSQIESNKEPVVITTISDALSKIGKSRIPHTNDVENSEETKDSTDYLKEYQDKNASLQQYLEKIKSYSFDNVDMISIAKEFDIAGDSISDVKRQILSLMNSSTSEILFMIDELISSSQVEEGTKKELLDIKDAIKGINDETQNLNSVSSSVTSVASAFSDITDVKDMLNIDLGKTLEEYQQMLHFSVGMMFSSLGEVFQVILDGFLPKKKQK